MFLRTLLTAPASVDADEWNEMKGQLHDWVRPLLSTHTAELRHHILREGYTGPTGTLAVGIKVRRDAAGAP